MKKRLIAASGWVCFAAGWAGIFLPGLPTTIFWILAALAFLRTNERMYRRIIADRRFGPSIRIFVEEGRVSRRGKAFSIAAMLASASAGALAIPSAWVKAVVIAAAIAGSAWVFSLPSGGAAAPLVDAAEAASRGRFENEA
jgi:uncharacterized protein